MPANHQHFFTRCPHCRTMFRVSTAVSEQSEGWAKCGHCKKILEIRKNEIDPKDYLQADESVAQDKVIPKLDTPQLTDTAASNNPTNSKHSNETLQQRTPASIELSPTPQQITKDIAKQHSVSNSIIEPIPAEKPEPTKEQLSFIENKQADNVLKSPQRTLSDSAAFDNSNKKRRPEPTLQAQHHSGYGRAKKSIKQESTSPDIRRKTAKVKNSGDSEASLVFRSARGGIETDTTTSIKTDSQKLAKGSQMASSIVARAQRFKRDNTRSNPAVSYLIWVIVLGLVALLIWQVAIVNYTKLKNYNFLTVPLNFTCAIFSCNQQAPSSQSEFEILHAGLRRHTSVPGVITISANLINYSNSDRLLPSVRLDLTDSDESIVASKTINLVENPQYLDPAISQLAPGQDLKIVFDVNRPPRAAVGFTLNIVD